MPIPINSRCIYLPESGLKVEKIINKTIDQKEGKYIL
jgi:hypothetical protein